MKNKWFIDETLNLVKEVADYNYEEAARRVYDKAQKRCPIGEWERGIIHGKTWTARKPGSLKNSIKLYKSKYEDGGWIVMAGSFDVFYASFVELGVPAHHIPKDPFLRGPLSQEKRRFRAKLKASLP